MAERHLLVLLMDEGRIPQLRRTLSERRSGDLSVRVVAPTHLSGLQWLATDEDEARAEAETRALQAEWLLTDEAEVEGEAGDFDAVQAVEDALNDFDADEILVAGEPRDNGGLVDSLRRFHVPITPIGAEPLRPRNPLRQGVRSLVGGRSKATPFVFFTAVNLFLLALAAVIALLVLLVVWLL
jgi:hypothetical protein